MWEQALALDPDNRIVRANLEAMHRATTPAAPVPAAVADDVLVRGAA
jgi:hypothetical protein